MRRLAMLALVASSLLSGRVHAQATPQQGFAFCTITDTSRVPAKVWASQVVEVEYPGDDHGGFRRSLALADEFLAVVQARGGEGMKNCNVTATAQEAARLRADTEATWNKRTLMMKIGDWREVAWTPKPWVPAVVPASLARYFLCSAMQTDLPERIALSRSVASGIIVRDVPGPRALEATFALNQAYTRDFQAVVQAHGLPVQGSCAPYDSLGEAQYAQQQQRKLMDGFNQKYTEVAWEPSAAATATALAQVSAPAAQSPVAPVAAPTPHGYCQVSRTAGDAMVWASSVFPLTQPPSPAYSEALASRFKSVVAGLGGEGDATCWLHPEGAAATGRMREHARKEWTTRMFARPGDWRDVAWSPDAEVSASKPATEGNPHAVTLAPTNQATGGTRAEDLPRPPAGTALRTDATAASRAAEGRLGMRVDAVSPTLAQGLGMASAQGAWVVDVVSGSVASKAGFKAMDVVLEVAGRPIVAATDLPAATKALEPGVETPVRVWRDRKTQDLIVTMPGEAADTTAPPSANGYSCVAQVSTTRTPPVVLHAPVHEFAGVPTDTATLTSTLTRLLGTVQASGPDWIPFDGVKCFPNDAVFPGETFCVATVVKRLRNITQVGAMFCNASREQTEARWQDMRKAAGAVATPLAWP